jgi:nucleoid DNA-binding protein
MNKSDLIKELSVKQNLMEKQAEDIVNLTFKGFMIELKMV